MQRPFVLLLLALPLLGARSARCDLQQFRTLAPAERQTFVRARQFLTASEGERFDVLMYAPRPLTPAQLSELDTLWQKGTKIALRYEYYKRHTTKSALDKARYDGLETWRQRNATPTAHLQSALFDPTGAPSSSSPPTDATNAGNATPPPAPSATSTPSPTPSNTPALDRDALDAAQARLGDYLSSSRNAEATARNLAALWAQAPGLSPTEDAKTNRDNTLAALIFMGAQNRTLIEQNDKIIAQNEQIIALLKQMATKK